MSVQEQVKEIISNTTSSGPSQIGTTFNFDAGLRAAQQNPDGGSSGGFLDSIGLGGIGDFFGAVPDFLKDNEGIISILGGGLATALGNEPPSPTGYQGRIPSYVFNRDMNQMDDTGRVPGSAGRRYFSDSFYSADESERGQGMPGPNMVYTSSDDAGTIVGDTGGNGTGGETGGGTGGAGGIIGDTGDEQRVFAAGGIAELADKGRYLRGGTDGMADKVPSSIEGREPAALSHGEFVIPADVVSHLGNGNSEAGAKALEQMMARIRKERTGNEKQGKEINPSQMLNV